MTLKPSLTKMIDLRPCRIDPIRIATADSASMTTSLRMRSTSWVGYREYSSSNRLRGV